MSTSAAFGISHQLKEHIPAMLNRLRVGESPLHVALDEAPAQGHIPGGNQQQTRGGGGVTSCSSRFLIVCFDRAGWAKVTDTAHVRAIDPHAKGIGGNDDFLLACGKGRLHLSAPLAVHSCVIGCRSPAIVGQSQCFFFSSNAMQLQSFSHAIAHCVS